MCSGCASSAGLRVTPWQSRFDGERDVASASPKSRPSSSGSRSMSLSPMQPRQSSRPSGRQRSSRLSSRWRGTRWAPISSPVWRTQEATSPACPLWRPSLLPNASSSYARLSPVFAVSRSWSRAEIPPYSSRCARCWQRLARSALRSPPPNSGAPKISRLPWTLKGRADALHVCNDALVNTHRVRINTSAINARLPTMHAIREYVAAGGLVSYGANFPDLFRRAADYVDEILRGADPGNIPVEQPTKFDLVINLTTAKALGLTIPEACRLRADEVIE